MMDEAKLRQLAMDWNVSWTDVQPIYKLCVKKFGEARGLGIMSKTAVQAMRAKQPVLPALEKALKNYPADVAQPPPGLSQSNGSAVNEKPRKGKAAK